MRALLLCVVLVTTSVMFSDLFLSGKRCDIFITSPDTAQAIALEYLMKQKYIEKNLNSFDEIRKYMNEHNCCNAFLGKDQNFPYWDVELNLPTRCGYLVNYIIWVNQCGGTASYKGSAPSYQNVPVERVEAEQSGKC